MDAPPNKRARAAAIAQRDAHFLGLHAPAVGTVEPELLDLYGTLREKTHEADRDWLLDQLRSAHRTLLDAAPADDVEVQRALGVHPVAWSIGHVAFTFESLVAEPLRRPMPEDHPPWTAAPSAVGGG